jgi:hypothetical protein
MAQLLKRFAFPKKSMHILVLLLSADLFFVLLHLAHKAARLLDMFSTIRNDVFNLYYDLTLAESFQYVKEYWIIILFAWLIIKKKDVFYTGWALLFTYLLFDDMLGFHGGLATFFLERFGIDSGHILFGEMRYQDFGELGVSLFFGILFLSLIAISYFRGGKEVRTIFHYLVGGLLLIVFFGVVNDFVNRIFNEDTNQIMFEISRLIEDGGEMLGMSVMCWYVFTLTVPDPTPLEANS